jgi:gamma-glutamylcysteine synthetase
MKLSQRRFSLNLSYRLAKLQSMISQLRKHLSEEDYQSTMEVAARSLKNAAKSSASRAAKRSRKSGEDASKAKGKKKARYVSPEVDDDMNGISQQESDQLL